jgi:hypothetical protein
VVIFSTFLGCCWAYSLFLERISNRLMRCWTF